MLLFGLYAVVFVLLFFIINTARLFSVSHSCLGMCRSAQSIAHAHARARAHTHTHTHTRTARAHKHVQTRTSRQKAQTHTSTLTGSSQFDIAFSFFACRKRTLIWRRRLTTWRGSQRWWRKRCRTWHPPPLWWTKWSLQRRRLSATSSETYLLFH